MPDAPLPITLSLAEDRVWLEQVGLPATSAQIATLQAYLDADAERNDGARRGFQITVFGHGTERSALDLTKRPLRTSVVRIRNLAALNVDVASVIPHCPALLEFTAETARSRVENLGALDLDITTILKRQPNALNYGPDAVRSSIAFLSLLGFDAMRVIHKLPSALGYRPESVVEKVQNFFELGLDGPKIVNHLPAAIGCAPEKVLLAAVLFQECGIWDRVRVAWNGGRNLALLIAPIESLALMAGYEPDRFAEKPTRAKVFAERCGWTTTKARVAALSDRITPGSTEYDPQFVRNLGMFVPFYIGRNTGRAPFTVAALCSTGRGESAHR